ncbi:hypothetical protein D3C72_1969470 [compost metagenome]
MATGSTRYSSARPGSSLKATKPTKGNQPSFNAKNNSSSKPIQKAGSDSSSVAPATSARSVTPPWRQAANMPAGTATSVASSTAGSTICALTAKRSRISGITGCWLAMEWPRSPCNTWPAQMAN